MRKLQKVCIAIYSFGGANINDRYVYTNSPTIV